MTDSDEVAAEFRTFCGDKRFKEFIDELHRFGRAAGRLRFWQEQLWEQFQKSSDKVLPSGAMEIATLFQAYIPAYVLHWHEMKDSELYVVDLVQERSGRRYLRPRRIEWPSDPDAAFTSEPAIGAQIRDWQCGQAPLVIQGTEFAFDAHGVWMTTAEAKHISSRYRGTAEQSAPPWVNGMPPVFPPK